MKLRIPKWLLVTAILVATVILAYAANKVTDLTALLTADNADVLMIIDTSESESKQITVGNFMSSNATIDANTTHRTGDGSDHADVATNTLKDTNVSTALSTGTVSSTSYGITSDGSTDDVILAQATTSAAGVLSAAKWDEIVANTSKVGVTDGDKGSITVSATGATWTLDDDAVTTAKILTDAVTMDSVDADGNFTSLTGNWATTGYLSGKLILDSGTGATLDVAAATHYGGVAINGDADAIEIDLDAALAGMSIMVLDGAGGAITLDPNGTETITYDGTAAAAGVALISSGAAGDSITLICVVNGAWIAIGHDANGWTEATP